MVDKKLKTVLGLTLKKKKKIPVPSSLKNRLICWCDFLLTPETSVPVSHGSRRVNLIVAVLSTTLCFLPALFSCFLTSSAWINTRRSELPKKIIHLLLRPLREYGFKNKILPSIQFPTDIKIQLLYRVKLKRTVRLTFLSDFYTFILLTCLLWLIMYLKWNWVDSLHTTHTEQKNNNKHICFHLCNIYMCVYVVYISI